MKGKFYLFIASIGLLQLLACKKEAQPGQTQQKVQSLGNGLVNFSINGQLIAAAIDTTHNTVVVTIPDSVNEQKLTANFTLAAQVTATVNNTAVSNSFVYDFSKPISFTVTSADKKRSTTFQVTVQTELQYFGLSGNVVSAKSLNKGYNFYFDQFDGSVYQAINCGPTVGIMAIKWADSTFTQTPVYARSQREPQGGWWTTSDVQGYLHDNGISSITDTLSISNIDSLVKTSIDNDDVIILCLDMYYVPESTADNQHINKFYQANTVGWGHFLLVKGYKQLQYTFYLEIYDPYSQGETYTILDVGQLKGKDRYYLDYDISTATQKWWPYAIIASQKGQKVIASTKGRVLNLKKAIPVASGR